MTSPIPSLSVLNNNLKTWGVGRSVLATQLCQTYNTKTIGTVTVAAGQAYPPPPQGSINELIIEK